MATSDQSGRWAVQQGVAPRGAAVTPPAIGSRAGEAEWSRLSLYEPPGLSPFVAMLRPHRFVALAVCLSLTVTLCLTVFVPSVSWGDDAGSRSSEAITISIRVPERLSIAISLNVGDAVGAITSEHSVPIDVSLVLSNDHDEISVSAMGWSNGNAVDRSRLEELLLIVSRSRDVALPDRTMPVRPYRVDISSLKHRRVEVLFSGPKDPVVNDVTSLDFLTLLFAGPI